MIYFNIKPITSFITLPKLVSSLVEKGGGKEHLIKNSRLS
jgi:hypothetical protein